MPLSGDAEAAMPLAGDAEAAMLLAGDAKADAACIKVWVLDCSHGTAVPFKSLYKLLGHAVI